MGQLAINKAVENFNKKLNACVKSSDGHLEFSQLLTNCLLCCSNDNVFFCSANIARLSFCAHFAACEREK